MEAYSLKLVAEENAVITHAPDSTTGLVALGRKAFTSIVMNTWHFLSYLYHQKKQRTQKTDFDILPAASDKSAGVVCVDLHMTDSTNHDNSIAKECTEALTREKPSGQLFCNSHTALGFDAGIQSVINKVETAMMMENIFKGFIEIDVDQKNDSVSLTFHLESGTTTRIL